MSYGRHSALGYLGKVGTTRRQHRTIRVTEKGMMALASMKHPRKVHKAVLHAESIEQEFRNRFKPKYMKGFYQYRSLLSDKSELELVEEMINEALDQLSYAVTIRQKILERRKHG